MNEKEIARINELYHKSKAEGLTEAEKAEQACLRKAYIESVRRNMQQTLNNVSIINEDGSVTHLKDIKKRKKQ